jgi:hypothetical protein
MVSCLFILNPAYVITHSSLDVFTEAAFLKHSHTQDPGSVDDTRLKSVFLKILEKFQNNHNAQSTIQYSLVIIDLLREFQAEVYFTKYLTFDLVSKIDLCEWTLVLIAAVYKVTLRRGLRIILLIPRDLLYYDQGITVENLILQKARQDIVHNTFMEFREGILDSWLVKFSISLYFCREFVNDLYCITVLVQLAK